MTGFLSMLLVTVAMSCLGQSRNNESHGEGMSGSYGSIAVAIVRDDTIVVAADSRTVTDDKINPDTTCKITVVNDVVFAATGLLKGNQNAFGILDYARSVLQGPAKIPYKLDTYQSGTSTLLTSWLNIIEDGDSIAASSYYRNSHSIQSMFCFFSGSKPVVVAYSFTPSFVGKRFKIGGVYDAAARKSGEMIRIGATTQTDMLLKKDEEFSEHIRRLDAVSAAKALVRKQMEFTPRIVGGEIDIVLITSKGASWIHRKQNCD